MLKIMRPICLLLGPVPILFIWWHGTYIRMVTQNMLRKHKGTLVFSEKNTRLVTALQLIECLNQIEYHILFFTCAPISELTSNISTMTQIMLRTHEGT